MASVWKRRFCLFLELLLDASLLFTFVLQALVLGCLLVYGYIPIPQAWAEKQIATRHDSVFTLTAQQFQLGLDGTIRLVDLEIAVEDFREPILRAAKASAHFSLRNGGTWQPHLQSLTLADGTFYLPAVYAPDGRRTAILEKIAFRAGPKGSRIEVESFAAKHADIHLRGSINWPTQPAAESPEAMPMPDLFKTISNALKAKDRFALFSRPTLAFKVNVLDDESVRIFCQFSSRQLQHTEVTGTHLRAETVVLLKDGEWRSESPLVIRADTLKSRAYPFSATGVVGCVDQDDWKGLLEGKWPIIEIFAHSLHLDQVALLNPNANINLAAFPTVDVKGSTSGLKGAVTFSGNIDVADQSGTLEAKGHLDLLSLVPEAYAARMPRLEFDAAPYYDLAVRFGPGHSLEAARFAVYAQDIVVEDIAFDYVHAKGNYQNSVFALDDAFIRRGLQQSLDAQFSFDLNTSGYYVTLIGFAIPYEYNALLPGWWATIFEDFKSSETSRGLGDFIIYGNVNASVPELYYGHATVSDASFHEVWVDHASLIVRGRGRYVEVHDIDAVGSGGWAKGHVAFFSRDDDGPGPASVRFKFDSRMPVHAASRIFGGNVAAILNDFETTQLPLIHLEGAHFHASYPEYAGLSYFDLKADSAGAVRFKDVPLDHLRFNLYGRETTTHLRDVEFGYAQGIGQAAIDILTPVTGDPELRFELDLKNADRTLAVQNLPDTTAASTPTESPTTPARTTVPRIDLQLHARGPIDDIFAYSGNGSFLVMDEALGSIQLLGPLSSLLKDTPLNFTSFNLNRMQATFLLDRELLRFDEIEITGVRTRIDGTGTLRLPDQQLDMRVNVDLFGNLGNPDSRLRKVGNLLTSPIPTLLDFELSGTIDDPRWRSAYDPRNLLFRFGNTLTPWSN